MPTYILRHKETGEEKEVFMSISEMKRQTDPEAGEYTNVIKSPRLITHTDSIIGKTSGDWRDLLKKINKNAGSKSKVNY